MFSKALGDGVPSYSFASAPTTLPSSFWPKHWGLLRIFQYTENILASGPLTVLFPRSESHSPAICTAGSFVSLKCLLQCHPNREVHPKSPSNTAIPPHPASFSRRLPWFLVLLILSNTRYVIDIFACLFINGLLPKSVNSTSTRTLGILFAW